jgi:hypothetical protein
MSDITLTSGIRQNLLSLQNTSADLNTTQEALATGKAVNSAADNPSAYFTSQNLTNSANSLSALLDQIGQGSQTINAATNGLTGLTSLLQQALSTAQQAPSASWTTAGSTTGTVDITTTAIPSAAAGNLLINVGSSTYTVAITAARRSLLIEAAINGTTGLGSAAPSPRPTTGGTSFSPQTATRPFTVDANATSLKRSASPPDTGTNNTVTARAPRGPRCRATLTAC